MTVTISETSLATSIYIKKLQTIKYLNSSSNHPKWQLRNISSGVFKRLARLTTMNSLLIDSKIVDVYPLHKQALDRSGLNYDKKATFKSILENLDKKNQNLSSPPTNNTHKPSQLIPNGTHTNTSNFTLNSTGNPQITSSATNPTPSVHLKKNNASNSAQLSSGRRIYFCTKYIPKQYMHEPLHCIIKRLMKLFNININFSMSYSRHANLGECLFGDLVGKLMVGVEDLNLSDLRCNCQGGSSKCKMPGICGKQNCIYSMTCNKCPSKPVYVGSTARSLKTRTTEHLYLVRKFFKFGTKSDSFVAHMSTHFDNHDQASMQALRSSVDFGLITNLRNAGRAGTDNCGLCAAERYNILIRLMRGEEIMNCRDELLFNCRHVANFPRWKTIEYDDVFLDITDDPD